MAIIRVGGDTEIEMKERKERVKDAVLATKAAVEEGIVSGGEIALLDARAVLEDSLGAKILKNALEAPFKKLLNNAGMRSDYWIEHIADKPGVGVDLSDNKPRNLMEAGIVDPVKVCKYAVKNAVSTAIQIMTVGVTIVPVEDKKDVVS